MIASHGSAVADRKDTVRSAPSANGPVKSERRRNVADAFHRFARRCSELFGNPWSFSLAIVLIVGWAVTGPLFNFSDTWQLVINTATTIVTFLMVFMIQNTQNRDARAIHLKLDELLHGVKGARNRLICLENLTEEELNELQEEFVKLRKKAPGQPCPPRQKPGGHGAV